MTVETEATATVEGELEKTPFGHVLIYCLGRGLSGSFRVGARPEATPETTLLVRAGCVVAAQFDSQPESLRDGLAQLCTWTRGHYAFYGGRNLLDGAAGALEGQEDPRAVVAHALRRDYPAAVINEVVDTLREVHVAPNAELDLAPYALTPLERAWVQAIDGPVATVTLLQDGGLGEAHAARLLYLLRATRAIQVVQAPAAAAPPRAAAAAPVAITEHTQEASQSPAAPAADTTGTTDAAHDFEPRSEVVEVGGAGAPGGLDAELTALWREVRARHRRLPHDNCFELLDLPHDANSAAAVHAFEALSARLRPDSLPPALQALVSEAGQVFARMREAVQTLGAPARRLVYLCDLDAGGGTPAAPHGLSRVWSVQRHVREAGLMLRQQRHQEALWHAGRATGADPHHPEAQGTHAYAQFLLGPRTQMDTAATLGALERAVRCNPDSPNLHYYIGTVLKHAGYEGRASDHLRRASLAPPARPQRPESGPQALAGATARDAPEPSALQDAAEQGAAEQDAAEQDAAHEVTRRAKQTTGRLFGKLA